MCELIYNSITQSRQNTYSMDTTQKGSIFEEIVFNYFNHLIKNGYFGFTKDQCLLTRQKAYYSRDREKEIFFDLSLELFFPQQNIPFLIILIECKNYNKKVPIDGRVKLEVRHKPPN